MKKWRTINKGPTLMKDGVTHHWCKHHVYEGRYDGPTMLKVLLGGIYPTASVNVELHCLAIEVDKL